MVVLVYCRLDTTEKKVSKYEGITIDTIQMKNRKKRDQKKKKTASVSWGTISVYYMDNWSRRKRVRDRKILDELMVNYKHKLYLKSTNSK